MLKKTFGIENREKGWSEVCAKTVDKKVLKS